MLYARDKITSTEYRNKQSQQIFGITQTNLLIALTLYECVCVCVVCRVKQMRNKLKKSAGLFLTAHSIAKDHVYHQLLFSQTYCI